MSEHMGCKHLDYEEGKYTDCTIVTIEPEGWKHWRRHGEFLQKDAPRDVQFCKLRGRINGIFECIDPGEMPCFEAQDSPIGEPEGG